MLCKNNCRSTDRQRFGFEHSMLEGVNSCKNICIPSYVTSYVFVFSTVFQDHSKRSMMFMH